MAKGDHQWHVPAGTWESGSPGGLGVGNIGTDIVQTLISTDSAVNLDVPDAATEYVVERVVGQWMIHGNQATPGHFFVHQRVYPTVSDTDTVVVRDLTSPDDAESDFLWHAVSGWSTQFDTDTWGTWENGGDTSPVNVGFMGRMGHIDIRVNRRIKQGFSLIWHTQFAGAVEPLDGEFNLYLWLRMLLREG